MSGFSENSGNRENKDRKKDRKKEIFSEIFDEHIDKIYRFALLKVNSREAAQDIASETFLRGWKAFKERPGGKAIKNPRAFLYRIARNLVVDHYRKKARIKIVPAENAEIADFGANPEEKSLLDSDISLVKEALGKIRDEYREMIIWRYLEDLSIAEIAEISGKSEGAARVAVHRALKALKKELAAAENGGAKV